MSAAPRSLVRRIAWATWAVVAVSSACVALASALLADRFAELHEEQHLTDAASILLSKMRLHPTTVAITEARESMPTGVRVAAYEGATLVVGDARIPRPLGPGCTVEGAVAACAIESGRVLVVATSDRHALLRRQRQTLVVPLLLAVALTSLVGAVFATRLATMLLAPLSRLRDALKRVPDDAPERAELGVDEDVAEVDALRGALHETFVRLGHSLSTSRRFAADAAHELRSPLAVIMGQLELGSHALTGEARAANERARATAARLATLVERLLVLATPASKLRLGEEVELQGAVEEALDLVPTAAWPRIEVSAEAAAFVHGDRTLLAAMIANAIENALKFSEGAVRVSVRATAERAELRITDDGPGIPADYRERVFEPFYRTPEARGSTVRGHGIGLSLIAHVARVHGGSPRFAPTERGSCLVIDLPRAR